MEKWVRDSYTDAVLGGAFERYGVDRNAAKILDGFESLIYECPGKSDRFVLRISHSAHRSWQVIRGEMEYIRYLSDNGVSVARPILSPAGNLVEVIRLGTDDHHFTAAAFEWAKGGPPRKLGWTPSLFRSMGAFMGRMHTLAKAFAPSDPAFRRPDWSNERSPSVAKVPPSERVVVERYEELMSYLGGLPRSMDSYGLIHVDFHPGNFFLDVDDGSDPGKITLFDFDDCQYSWFAYDIAMSIFYALPVTPLTSKDIEEGHTFCRNFMEGYRAENYLDPVWMREIPHFLRLREVDLYLAILSSGELESLGKYAVNFMQGRREKIESRTPYAALDFTSI